MIKTAFQKLDKFQREAAGAGELHRVFCGSMMDIAEKSKAVFDYAEKAVSEEISGPAVEDRKRSMIPIGIDTGDLRDRLFNNIDQGRYPNLVFLFLTKRPSNLVKVIPSGWVQTPPSNVMYGTSISHEGNLGLVDQLIKVPGRRFISVEPQISRIELRQNWGKEIHWIIQGGESGHGRRRFDLSWARSMRDQANALAIPYFFKQVDKVQPIPPDLVVRQIPAFAGVSKIIG